MDLLYLFIVAVCAFFAILVIALIVGVTLKYPRQNPDAVGADIHGAVTLELAWTFIPFVFAIAMFGWSAAMFFKK
jgi:heme/copper-type cytochrome/quinol oxidase subunit 2